MEQFDREKWLIPASYGVDTDESLAKLHAVNRGIDNYWMKTWTANADTNWEWAKKEPWVDDKFYGKAPSNTVMVCGSGPSLVKQMRQVKLAVAAGCPIIAVDRAFKTLKEHKVVPSMVVCGDAQDTVADFITGIDKRSYAVLNLVSSPKTAYAARRARKRIWYGSCNPYSLFWGQAAGRFGRKILCLRPGLIVTFSAVDIAIWAGFENIVMVGNDLCYPTRDEARLNCDPGEELECADGRWTIPHFAMASKNFTLFPVLHPDRTFVDLSGGLTQNWRTGKFKFGMFPGGASAPSGSDREAVSA